jgi:hypothetical protein
MGNIWSIKSSVAKKVGVKAATVNQYLIGKIIKLKKRKKFYYDNRTWLRTSYEIMAKDMPFFTEHEIRTAIAKLIKAEFIIRGNYNWGNFNKTVWYALKNEKRSFK